MVGVPAHGPGDVEGQLFGEQEQGGDFIRNHFRWVVVAVIQQAEDAVFGGIVHVKLMGADGIGFQSQAEDFGFHGIVKDGAVQFFGENFVQGFL